MNNNVEIKIVNRTNDTINSDIVIYQENDDAEADLSTLAWKVLPAVKNDQQVLINIPMDVQIAVKDSWGNLSPRINASQGQSFRLKESKSGNQLVFAGKQKQAREIEVKNDLTKGAVNAQIYKDGKLLLSKENLSPGQKANFHIESNIWIGIVPNVKEGQVLDSAILKSVNTKINLLGITSADIVMTGGGSGPEAKPYEFKLENVVYA